MSRKLPIDWRNKYAGKYQEFMRLGCPSIIYITKDANDENADRFFFVDGGEVDPEVVYQYYPNLPVVAKKVGKPVVDTVVMDMVIAVKRGLVTETEAAEQLAPLGLYDKFRELMQSENEVYPIAQLNSQTSQANQVLSETNQKKRRGRPPKSAVQVANLEVSGGENG